MRFGDNGAPWRWIAHDPDMTDAQKIGRFEIQRLLGRGAQSSVYLAFDPHLEREVAIKTLHFAGGDASRSAVLLKEARTVSKLRHANLVPIFEAGEQGGDPYLVFEYVDGQTLAELIRESAPLAVTRAIEIMVHVLDAVGHVHDHGAIHRDLKPSNILINGQGVPRVMDFGIATRLANPEQDADGLCGTPAYMSPEYVSGQPVTAQSDVFAAGLILYEMLFGRRAFPQANAMEVIYRIAHSQVEFPEAGPAAVDDALRGIVAKATAIDPQMRFDSARQMRQALQDYLAPKPDVEPPAQAEGAKGTLEFLLRRMRHKSDFPAMSEAIRAVTRLTSSERENLHSLSGSILKDFALTNKILRLVNSAYYRPAGAGNISTVSRATVLLGIDAIRSIAVSLILFEHLQNQRNAALLKEEFVRANFSGALAKGFGHQLLGRDTEEGYICAMFFNLGRLLTQYYLPEEAETIRRLVAQQSASEDAASARVLGMRYEELGMGVAKAWGFPDSLVRSMRRVPEGKVRPPTSRDEKLRVVAAFASELFTAIEGRDADQQARELARLKARFADALPVSDKELKGAMAHAMRETADFCSVVRFNLSQSKLGRQLMGSLNAAETSDSRSEAAAVSTGDDKPDRSTAATVLSGGGTETHDACGDFPRAEELGPAAETDASTDAQAILTAGIQDISNSLVEEFSLSDLLRIILETMYRAMGFKRVLMCIRDPRTNSMNARFGLGPDVPELVKRFRFPLGDMKNIFSFVLARGVDILISDASEQSILQRLPQWYRKAVGAETFILFPLVVKNVPVALIYADKDVAGEIVVSDKELALLRTLRNQAALAIRQAG
jgi:serine/threonine protein kinase